MQNHIKLLIINFITKRHNLRITHPRLFFKVRCPVKLGEVRGVSICFTSQDRAS